MEFSFSFLFPQQAKEAYRVVEVPTLSSTIGSQMAVRLPALCAGPSLLPINTFMLLIFISVRD
jgi:hypothetical protein